MYFNKEVIEQIKNISIIDFCIKSGIDLINENTGKSILNDNSYCKFYKVPHCGGLFISSEKNVFYKFTDNTSGDIINFCKIFYNESFIDACNRIHSLMIDNVLNIKNNNMMNYQYKSNKKISEDKDLIIPQKDKDVKKVFAYLIKRGIDKTIISENIKNHNIMQMIYNGYSNVAFAGYNNGELKYLMLRSCYYDSHFKHEIEGSKKEYGFELKYKNSDSVYVFESAIDSLSHASLFKLKGFDYQKDYRISEGGLSDRHLDNFLKNNQNVKNIIFCFDNDRDKKINYGQEKAKELLNKYSDLGYNCSIDTPVNKDFNEDLIDFIKEISECIEL